MHGWTAMAQKSTRIMSENNEDTFWHSKMNSRRIWEISLTNTLYFDESYKPGSKGRIGKEGSTTRLNDKVDMTERDPTLTPTQ
jgi:hypothetical protein